MIVFWMKRLLYNVITSYSIHYTKLYEVINGGLSAIGAALALAHPLSVVTAFFAAPITSLNPTIGAGMVVGLVESYLRKPRVSDFETP